MRTASPGQEKIIGHGSLQFRGNFMHNPHGTLRAAQVKKQAPSSHLDASRNEARA
jgi:hypothetical protein